MSLVRLTWLCPSFPLTGSERHAFGQHLLKRTAHAAAAAMMDSLLGGGPGKP